MQMKCVSLSNYQLHGTTRFVDFFLEYLWSFSMHTSMQTVTGRYDVIKHSWTISNSSVRYIYNVYSYNNFQQRNPPIWNRIQKQSIVFMIFIPLAFNNIPITSTWKVLIYCPACKDKPTSWYLNLRCIHLHRLILT
jgi:hypothetical protein